MCSRALDGWRDALAESIGARGVTEVDARRVATLVVAGIEGALLLARAGRSPEPLRIVGEELSALLRSRVPGAGP